MPAHGKYLTGTATTDAVAGSKAVVKFTVPSGVSWIFDYATVAVNATNNIVRIRAGGNSIWEDLTDVTTETPIDFATRYPRALQVDAGETIEFEVETKENVAKTITAKVWVIEG
jgi:hypothetical protein